MASYITTHNEDVNKAKWISGMEFLISCCFVLQIPVEVNAIRPEEFEVLDDTTICEVCGAADNEDRLLLCDSCNHG